MRQYRPNGRRVSRPCPPLPPLTDGTAASVLRWAVEVIDLYQECAARHRRAVEAAARPKLSYLGLIGGGGLRERRPTEDELQRVLAWLASEKGQVYADAVLFSTITAMRRGEVCRIAWADLDESKKMVLIRDRKDPRQKVGNDQWVPLLGDSWAIVKRQAVTDDARIFPLHVQTLSKYFTEACRALSIPDLHLHDLRHEGISAMFERGFDIAHVAVVSGHRDWRHLKRYTQIKPETLHKGPHK